MTAVEWLIEQIIIKTEITNEYILLSDKDIYDIIEQAKQMEKQQIIDAYEASEMNENEIRYKIVCGERFNLYEHAEDYYNETFKK
jgi:hypothetical protein